MAQKMAGKGFNNVQALKGGWRSWSRAKYPVDEK